MNDEATTVADTVPAPEENTPHEPAVETASQEQAVHGEVAPTIETAHNIESAPPEVTPAPKKPRKSTKSATAEKATPTEVTPAAEAVAPAVAAAAAASDAPATVEATAVPAPAPENNKKWYVVKIQSGREDTIKAAIERKVKIEGLEEFYGQIAIPVEELVQKKSVRVTDKKTGDKVTQEKKVIKYIKKFPGYLFA
jgi:transcriptional antiterminator NusG